jgi:hypothetical protein
MGGILGGGVPLGRIGILSRGDQGILSKAIRESEISTTYKEG